MPTRATPQLPEHLVVLAGNPNAGKSSLFNQLTGEHAHVGNYPGVTVERREGRFEHGGRRFRVVDLPGTYSLTAYTAEEVVARKVILDERPDVIVHVADASNLERNLYLAVQLLELERPAVIALNMSDLAEERGFKINAERLGRLLGAAVVPTVATHGQGLDELKATIAARAADPAFEPRRFWYGRELESHIAEIEALIEKAGVAVGGTPRRWLALKLLEQDGEVRDRLDEAVAGAWDEVAQAVDRVVAHLKRVSGDEPEILLADRRYGVISGACQEAVVATVESRHDRSDRIDAIVLHPLAGWVIFLGAMYLVFQATFTLGRPGMQLLGMAFDGLAGLVTRFWPAGAPEALRSLLAEGVIGGVGGVITFLPNIFFLFVGIAFLEDSGYMARAAFLTDRLMHRVGLHGRSFIPMILGFGCTVPAILATRTLENRRDRLVTMLVLPLFSCGARFPIYTLIIPAFFPPRAQAPVLYLVYAIGVALALVLARILSRTLLTGESEPFVMELPPFRLPTLAGLAVHGWERARLFLRKAGTIILAMSVVMWILLHYPAPTGPADPTEALRVSAAGRIGTALEPVLRPMGFDWRLGTALIGALAAKEMFVAQLGILFAAGEAGGPGADGGLVEALRAAYSPATGLAIILFMLIAMPCLATLAATRGESGRWRWALLQFGGLTIIGYLAAVLAYQVTRLVWV